MAKTAMNKRVTFIQPRHLPSVIWDPDNDRPLCEFKQFTYTTDDPKIIRKLKDMGYSVEGIDPVPAHLHEEGKPPAEPVIVNDQVKVPPRPKNVPINESMDLSSPKPSAPDKKPKRSLKKKKRK